MQNTCLQYPAKQRSPNRSFTWHKDTANNLSLACPSSDKGLLDVFDADSKCPIHSLLAVAK